ncbi:MULTISPECIES: hypothetical protein [unclassified Mesorhizobium]|uniref:hypothetical protein n=1 Tax=unclassified Mesorhizobium TaxID=325217 RepID=UPI001CCFAB6A|nr:MULTISPECIES: hypothetical protein [unclassified Mesorhizobium]MCA0000395.1 hypothetical protein [Mesorhizobium sp. B264B2A]MCA0010258.1 hypothetical protein [Mesorhizobium sp. B264B1B]MCA0016872.1 hypothetical protein [Mesorhizobium sp. B264B1A]
MTSTKTTILTAVLLLGSFMGATQAANLKAAPVKPSSPGVIAAPGGGATEDPLLQERSREIRQLQHRFHRGLQEGRWHHVGCPGLGWAYLLHALLIPSQVRPLRRPLASHGCHPENPASAGFSASGKAF